MTKVALVWLVYQTTNSPAAIAILLVCYTAPVAIGGLLAGKLLDEFDKRTTMMADNVVRGVAVAAVPVLYFLGLFQLWEAYAFAVVYGFFWMITLAGSPSVIPDLVEEKELTDANALETLTFTISGVVGPPLAGIIIVSWGAQNVMLVDAVSYVAIVAALASIQLPSHTALGVASKGSLKEALKLLFSNRILLSTTLMFMAFNFGDGTFSLWLPILSKTVLSGGATLYGSLLGILAAGSVAGAAIAGRLSSRWPAGGLIVVSQFVSGLALFLLVLGQSLWLAVGALAVLGFFSAPLTAWAQTLRMKVIPAQMRGRTFAVLRTMMQSAPPAGSGVGGVLLPGIGLVPLIGLSAAFIGVPGLLGSQLKELRSAR
jgi:MFS family permease